MDLRKLEIFVRVAQLKNFSRAAEALHMAQPAVSIAVRKLEESLETTLFDRSGRRIELTAEGHNLLNQAQSILRDVDKLTSSVSAMNKLLTGELTLACPSMVVYESGYFIRSKLDQLCANQSIEPDFRMQTNFLPLLIKMVKEGLGTTVGLKIMGDEEPGITGIALQPSTRIRMALAKRRGRTISRANQTFLDWAAFKL